MNNDQNNPRIKGSGIDVNDYLYVLSIHQGKIYRIVPAASSNLFKTES